MLVRSLDQATVPSGSGQTCPADTGAQAAVIFTYDGRSPITLQVHLSGCQFATNGYRLVAPRERTVEWIAAFLGAPRQ